MARLTASVSDAASMRLKAERGERDGVQGWILNGQKTWTTSAHFAEWYWLGTRTDPGNKHRGITLMLVPLDQPAEALQVLLPSRSPKNDFSASDIDDPSCMRPKGVTAPP